MVHADIQISRAEKLLEAGAEDTKLFHSFRQMRFEGALLFFQPGHVSVAEHGNAIGAKRERLIDGRAKTVGGLVREAVNQINVDALKADFARGYDEVTRHFIGLDAMDGLLNFWLEILNAHAQAVEAKTPQGFQLRAAGYARVHFDTDFGIGGKRKTVVRVMKEIFHLRDGQIGWRSAAPVELDYGTVARNFCSDVIDFALESIEVGHGDFLVFLYGNGAGAKQAKVFAKRNVHVERERSRELFGARVIFFQVVGAEVLFPDWRGWITGVARAGAIIFFEEGVGNLGDLVGLERCFGGFCRVVC